MAHTSYFIISDLHVFDSDEKFLFNRKKERVFVRLAEEIARRRGRLVLAGDIFDLTGMTPCRIAHRDFFREAVPSERYDAAFVDRHCRIRSTLELLGDVARVFPDLMKALAELARSGQLIYIPGNHDCDFLTADGRAALQKVLQLPAQAITWEHGFSIGSFLITAHGDEFDEANSTLRGCLTPGSIFTSALYQGVIPALRLLGLPDDIVSAVPAVRPEEQTLTDLQHYLGKEKLSKLLLAFARLLQRNDYFQGFSRLPSWFLSHNFPVVSPVMKAFITPARVRGLLPNDEKLKLQARKGAAYLRSRNVEGASFAQATVVLGHTHELDVQSDYFNLGTWIDHLNSLAPKTLLKPDERLPILHLQEGKKPVLYDGRGLERGALEECAVLGP